MSDVDDDAAGTTGGEEGSEASTVDPATTASGTSGPSTSPGTTTGPGTTTADPDTGSSGGSSSSSGEDTPEFEPICEGDGAFDFSISGTNQGEHEGRLAWASAVEPEILGSPEVPDAIAVLLQASIEGGAFELSCPSGLTENSAYPSIAVVIDADDSGVCSDGDLAFMWQLFAWSSDQVLSFDGTAAYSHENDPPWLIADNAFQPVGEITEVWGMSFCDYYFE